MSEPTSGDSGWGQFGDRSCYCGTPVWTAVEKPIYSQAVRQSPDMMTRHTSTSLLIRMAVSYFGEQRTEKS